LKIRSEERRKEEATVEAATINLTGRLYYTRWRGTGVERDGNGGRGAENKGERGQVEKLRT